MKTSFALFSLCAVLGLPLQTALGRVFPPIKPEDLAKIQAAIPDTAAKPAHPRRLLVFYRTEGFVHSSIPYGNEALKEIGEKTGAYTADFSDDMSVFTPENLKKYDGVLFNSTTQLKFADPAQRQALLDFVKSGKGFMGIHAATDNFYTWPEAQDLIGGTFHGHPWHADATEAVKIDDPSNPVVAAFDGKGFWINDEIYQIIGPFSRTKEHVLLSLDMSKPQNKRGTDRTDNDFPICWIKNVDGGGRVFYCSFGHNESIFWTPQILRLYLAGIQFALGDLSADATPSAQLNPQPQPALAPETPAPLNAPSKMPGMHTQYVKPVVQALDQGVKAVAAYDYGKDRTAVVAFLEQIRGAGTEDRAQVEKALLPLLQQPDVALGGKDLVCRWLAFIGTDASVPELKKLVSDPKLGHLAIYALMDIGTPQAVSALAESLNSGASPQRLAVMNVLGRKGVASVVGKLSLIAAASDKQQAEAAIDALAGLGTGKALAELEKVDVDPSLKTTRQWAVIDGAFRLLKKEPSETGLAKAAFARMLKKGTLSSLRVAAANGSIQADPAEGWAVLLPLLKDSDPGVCLDSAKLVGRLPSHAIPDLATALPSLDPAVQVVILNTLAGTRSAEIEPVLKTALDSTEPEVHLAAVRAYGDARLAGSAPILIPLLDKGTDDEAAAVDSLEKLPGADINPTLVQALAQAKGPIKAGLLTILAERGDRAALDSFFAATGDEDIQVAESAFRGIEILAGPDDLQRILTTLPQAKTDSEHNSVRGAIIHAALDTPDKDKAAALLLGALNGASPDSRQILIAALVSVDSPKAIAGVQGLLQQPSSDERKDVIRALDSVHNADVNKLLLQAASQGTDLSEKILALRGYLDGIQAVHLREPQRVEAYRAAWPLATRDEERQAILDALKNMNGPEAKKAYSDLSTPAAKTT